jgi:hypothetical protein
MQKRSIKKEEIEFYKKCPHCSKEIRGKTEGQVEYNLNISEVYFTDIYNQKVRKIFLKTHYRKQMRDFGEIFGLGIGYFNPRSS